MAVTLHLLKGAHTALAETTIARQVDAGDQVLVALLPGADRAPALPPGVRARRVPGELSWEGLLDEIFAADHVVTW